MKELGFKHFQLVKEGKPKKPKTNAKATDEGPEERSSKEEDNQKVATTSQTKHGGTEHDGGSAEGSGKEKEKSQPPQPATNKASSFDRGIFLYRK